MLAKRRGRRRTQRTRTVTLPAPVGGLNTRDALDLMPATDAVVLDNWMPGQGALAVRDGYRTHVSGIGAGDVATLAELHSGTTRKLLAAGGGALYDASASASVLASGFSEDRWQTVAFNGQIGLVNGTDAPQVFDGSTVSAMTVSGTGLTPANLVAVMAHRSRTYFFEADSQDFWYSATDALGGTLTRFPLSRVGQFGGNLVCMGSWNVEGGSDVWGGGGIGEDMAVFCMSSGDVIVYRGDDPGSSWNLVGVYRAGGPVDVRGIARRGADLLVLTREGLVSVSRLVSEGRLGAGGVVSDKIRPTVADAVAEHGAEPGWQVLVHPGSEALILNVPIGDGAYEQYVMNTRTGAWARWTGIGGPAWAVFEDRLHFGDGAGNVRVMTGHDDDGAPIAGDVQTAFSAFGAQHLVKRCACLRPVFRGKEQASIGLAPLADFRIREVGPVATTFGPVAETWEKLDIDWQDWSDQDWDGAAAVAFSEWRAADGAGYLLGTRLTSATTDALQWESLTYQLETGEGMI